MLPTLRVFLSSFSGEDLTRVLDIRDRLASAGFLPWAAPYDIRPGDDFVAAITAAIKSAGAFVLLLSRNSGGSLSMHQELRLAREKPGLRVIPVRLEPCDVLAEFDVEHLQGIDLFAERGWDDLLRALAGESSNSLGSILVPPELVEACQAGECVAYVGAGVSGPMGFPTWRPLVRDLLTWASVRPQLMSRTSFASLEAALKAGDANLVADNVVMAAQNAGVYPELLDELRPTFLRDEKLGPVHDVLRQLGLGAALTTNFDRLLEKTFVGQFELPLAPVDTERLLDALAKRHFFLLKLYGDLESPETALVSPKQYEDAIVGNVAFSRFMEALFVSRTLLFLGASLDGIEAYLRGIKFAGRSRRPHYALVAVSGDTWRAKADSLLSRYGIQVLPYTLSVSHEEMTTFLGQLLAKVKPPVAPGATARGRSRVAPGSSKRRGLKRVRLEDIGPFRELEFDLNEGWNVFLGNNGVGKSSILRALGAAFCGREAALDADRVIRFGATSGKVILETYEEREYTAEFFRTSDSVEVKSLPAQMLEAEGWLVLGFPALRTVSWDPVKGPQLDRTRQRPTVADVLPIVRTAPDPRTDGIKQWIVNLDYRIKEDRSKGQRYRVLLDEFFEVMGRVTGNVKVQFNRVDVDRGRVLLDTDDGEVPLEAVSQGTVSLLGWMGVLMQRLFEVHDRAKRPTHEFALVLMDEIDAHMHPEWQQSLVPLLTEIFPNVQFLASTHSPLMVSGLEASQVFRFARDEDGAVRRVEIEPDMTMGRADQVLTSRLFGLETTLDVVTQKKVERYQVLLGKRTRSAEEEREFMSLRGVLALRIPSPGETPAERRATEMVSLLLKSQLGHEFPDVQAQLRQKAEQLFKALRDDR